MPTPRRSSGRFGRFRVIVVPTGPGATGLNAGLFSAAVFRVRCCRVIRVRPDATTEAGRADAAIERSAEGAADANAATADAVESKRLPRRGVAEWKAAVGV